MKNRKGERGFYDDSRLFLLTMEYYKGRYIISRCLYFKHITEICYFLICDEWGNG